MTAEGGECGVIHHHSSTQANSGSSNVNAPWAVSIGDTFTGEYLHECGGSIISKKIVLTAAHCVTGENFFRDTFVIIAGVFDLKNVDRKEKFGIDKVVHHPNWQKTGQHHVYYDAALIFANRAFIYNAHIQPICLPSVGYEQLPSKLVGHSVTVVGWGRGLQDRHSEELIPIDVTLRAREECNYEYEKANSPLQARQKENELPDLLQLLGVEQNFVLWPIFY